MFEEVRVKVQAAYIKSLHDIPVDFIAWGNFFGSKNSISPLLSGATLLTYCDGVSAPPYLLSHCEPVWDIPSIFKHLCYFGSSCCGGSSPTRRFDTLTYEISIVYVTRSCSTENTASEKRSEREKSSFKQPGEIASFYGWILPLTVTVAFVWHNCLSDR